MKLSKILVAALASGVMASSAMAEGFFVGGELGTASYPDFTGAVATSVAGAGYSASVSQDKAGTAFGIYGGQWLTENWGWEVAYTDLGSVSGTVTTSPANVFSNYKHSATALSAAALGGIKLGAGKLYGKAGLYSASTKFDTSTRSVSTSSTGLVIGGGYSMAFGAHVTGKVELAVYNGIKFQTYNAAAGTNSSENVTKLSVGVAYAF